MHLHLGSLIQTLESAALQLVTEDFHSAASCAESAGQAQTWTAGLSQAHCHNSKRCHQYPILPLAEDGLEQREYPAVIVGFLERCGCGGVAVRNSAQREPHRRPGHTARLPHDHSESCHVQNRHLEAPCHRLRWLRLPRDLFSRLSRAFFALAHIHSSARILGNNVIRIVGQRGPRREIGIKSLPMQCAHGCCPSHLVRNWLH